MGSYEITVHYEGVGKTLTTNWRQTSNDVVITQEWVRVYDG